MVGRNNSGEQRKYQRQCIRLPARYVGGLIRTARSYGLIVNKQPFTTDTYWVSGEIDALNKFRQKIDEEYLCGESHNPVGEQV